VEAGGSRPTSPAGRSGYRVRQRGYTFLHEPGSERDCNLQGKFDLGLAQLFEQTTAAPRVETQFGVEESSAMRQSHTQFNRNLSMNATFSYMRTGELQLVRGPADRRDQCGAGGVGATQRLGRYITVNATYTAIEQSTSAINCLASMLSNGFSR